MQSFFLLVALLLHPAAAALASSTDKFARAISTANKKRPIVVHLWDPNPSELTDFAIDDVSEACRKAGAAAILCQAALTSSISKEQEAQRGNFPGPLPIIVDCALKDLDAETCAGAKTLGAAAVGIRYYKGDYDSDGALEEALQSSIAAAEEAGLGAILLGEFGADGDEGVDGASGLASRFGAAAGLTKSAEEDGVALGCWDGSEQELQRLRGAGFAGLVLKNACQGDIAWGSRTKQPSLAAQALTKLIKAALSKGDKSIWGGAGGVNEASGEGSMESYFNRDNQPGRVR